MGIGVVGAIGILALLIVLGIRVLQEYERGVIFRFGRFDLFLPIEPPWTMDKIIRQGAGRAYQIPSIST